MPRFEFVMSSDQFSQAEVQPGAGETGDVVQTAANQRVLLPTTEKPISLYSSLVTHMSLKVESEHRMEPPTHAPYREYGQVDTCTGGEEAEGGVEEGREEGEAGGRVRGERGRESWIKILANWGSKRQSLSELHRQSFPTPPARTVYSNLERCFAAFIPLLVA